MDELVQAAGQSQNIFVEVSSLSHSFPNQVVNPNDSLLCKVFAQRQPTFVLLNAGEVDAQLELVGRASLGSSLEYARKVVVTESGGYAAKKAALICFFTLPERHLLFWDINPRDPPQPTSPVVRVGLQTMQRIAYGVPSGEAICDDRTYARRAPDVRNTTYAVNPISGEFILYNTTSEKVLQRGLVTDHCHHTGATSWFDFYKDHILTGITIATPNDANGVEITVSEFFHVALEMQRLGWDQVHLFNWHMFAPMHEV